MKNKTKTDFLYGNEHTKIYTNTLPCIKLAKIEQLPFEVFLHEDIMTLALHACLISLPKYPYTICNRLLVLAG